MMMTSAKKPVADLSAKDGLEPIEMTFVGVMVDPQSDDSYAVLEADNKRYIVPVNSAEGAMLTFIRSGCGTFTHINTIYQLYMSTMNETGRKLVGVTVEAHAATICYARLRWEDEKHRLIFNVCMLGDALILASLAKAKLFILRRVLDDMDADDEWPCDQEVIGR